MRVSYLLGYHKVSVYYPFKNIADNCDECALMEKELKKAAALIKHTKEKIEFGMITV